MSNEVYSKEVTDKFFEGFVHIHGTLMRMLLEGRIASGETSREDAVTFMKEMEAASTNAVAKGFYAGMADAVGVPSDDPSAPRPGLQVIMGGKSD